uniref:Uncharacterized protein n=1 Tax=Rhizophora mucronata TaxID=61149 RepID=A0A2P2N1X7_RHIMU
MLRSYSGIAYLTYT